MDSSEPSIIHPLRPWVWIPMHFINAFSWLNWLILLFELSLNCDHEQRIENKQIKYGQGRCPKVWKTSLAPNRKVDVFWSHLKMFLPFFEFGSPRIIANCLWTIYFKLILTATSSDLFAYFAHCDKLNQQMQLTYFYLVLVTWLIILLSKLFCNRSRFFT